MSEKSNQLLDVSEVSRGKKCGCICPSCKTPLIARQGTENQWHFAHASRTVYLKTKKECDFSFFVSVRLMARQTIKNTLNIKLPENIGQVEKYLAEYQHYLKVPFNITHQRCVTISNIKIEKLFMNSPVDIFGHIDEYSFILYFTHPGREVPLEFKEPSDNKCGIVTISLDQTHDLFLKAKSSEQSYQEILYNFLENDLKSKTWIFHPRQNHCKQLANEQLQQQITGFIRNHKSINKRKYIKNYQSDSEDIPIGKISRKQSNFECINCYTNWQGLEWSVCPKCKTHLYRRFKGYVSEKT